jgi:hypothetical protein
LKKAKIVTSFLSASLLVSVLSVSAENKMTSAILQEATYKSEQSVGMGYSTNDIELRMIAPGEEDVNKQKQEENNNILKINLQISI